MTASLDASNAPAVALPPVAVFAAPVAPTAAQAFQWIDVTGYLAAAAQAEALAQAMVASWDGDYADLDTENPEGNVIYVYDVKEDVHPPAAAALSRSAKPMKIRIRCADMPNSRV